MYDPIVCIATATPLGVDVSYQINLVNSLSQVVDVVVQTIPLATTTSGSSPYPVSFSFLLYYFSFINQAAVPVISGVTFKVGGVAGTASSLAVSTFTYNTPVTVATYISVQFTTDLGAILYNVS